MSGLAFRYFEYASSRAKRLLSDTAEKVNGEKGIVLGSRDLMSVAAGA